MKILALDDDKTVLNVIKTLLKFYGHEVDCADDAVVAVDMLKHSKYEFVLFDYKMPGHDGIWFLQNAGIPPSTKAVLMTAHAMRELIDRVFELGASGYLIKPFTAADLMRHIDFHVAKQGQSVFQEESGKSLCLSVPSGS